MIRPTPPLLLTLIAFLAMALASLWFTHTYALDLPRGDDWRNMPQALGEAPITLDFLLTPANEHYIPLPRALFALIGRLSAGDTRGIIFANVALTAAIAAIFLLLARRLTGRWRYTDAFIPLILLNFGMHVQFTRAIQIHFVSASLLLTLVIVAIALTPPAPRPRALLMIALLLLLLPAAGGTTLLFLPPLALWYAALAFSARHAPHRRLALTLAIAVPLLLAALTVISLLAARTGTAPLPPLAQVAAEAGRFASLAWGAAGFAYPLTGILTLLLILLIPALALHLHRRGHLHTPAALGFTALALGALLLVTAVAIARGETGLAAINPDRYTILLAPILGALMLLFTLSPARPALAVRYTLLALALLLLIPNTRLGIAGATRQQDLASRITRDLAAGHPWETIATWHDDTIFRPDVAAIPSLLEMLQRHHTGPFRGANIPPRPALSFDARPLEFSSVTVTFGTQDLPILKLPLSRPYPLGIRIRGQMHLTRPEPQAAMQLIWTPVTPAPPRGANRMARFRHFPPLPETSELVIYPDEPIRAIEIRPAREGSQLRIDSIDLLYPAE